MKYLFRADAGTRRGTGHVMRCLSLAQACMRGGGEPKFAMASEAPVLACRLTMEGIPVVRLTAEPGSPEDAAQTVDWAERLGVLWVILDGYHFDAAFQRTLKGAGLRLLVLDDYGHAGSYVADLVLNQNAYAEASTYADRKPYTRLLLGPRFALLRQEFVPWCGRVPRIHDKARRILISLGGADSGNMTHTVVNALKRLDMDEMEATVVIGPCSPHGQDLYAGDGGAGPAVRFLRSPSNMPELMAHADMAITAGGTTCYELAFMGLPQLIVVTADNQRAVGRELDRLGVGINLGWSEELSEWDLAEAVRRVAYDVALRRSISEKGRSLVDGRGADRVVTAMADMEQGQRGIDKAAGGIRVRQACPEDAEMLWTWANDPVVRANSFNTEPIAFESHKEWLAQKLASSGTRLWVLEIEGSPVAQIRYDLISGEMAEISFLVAPDCRGGGLGTRLLTLTAGMACRELGARRLRGVTFSDNTASIRAFGKAGFRSMGEETIRGHLCLVFLLECPDAVGEGK